MKTTTNSNPMVIEFSKNDIIELKVNGVVTHSIQRVYIFDTDVTNKYLRFEKKLNRYFGKKLRMVDRISNSTLEGYYCGLCENMNGDGVSYFFANPLKKDAFYTIPYGIIDDFKYTVIKD